MFIYLSNHQQCIVPLFFGDASMEENNGNLDDSGGIIHVKRNVKANFAYYRWLFK